MPHLFFSEECALMNHWQKDLHFFVADITGKGKLARNGDIIQPTIKRGDSERLCNWTIHDRTESSTDHTHIHTYLCNPWFTWHFMCNPWRAVLLECVVTWAADTLGDEAPHEVGTILAPVWPSKGVYLRLEATWLCTHKHTLHIAVHCCVQSELENLPFDVVDTDYSVIPSYSGWDPSPNESICIYKAD